MIAINPNWKENMLKTLEKQAKCKHQWVNTIWHHAHHGRMGDKTTGSARCRKCGKHNDLQWDAHDEEEWIEIDKRAKFRSDFE